VTRWDAWRPVPFGRDARNRTITLALVWTSLLIGAIPRQGKTFAARLPAAGLILDPHTRLYVADFKGGKDWNAAAQVAHRFLSGDEPAHVLTLIGWSSWSPRSRAATAGCATWTTGPAQNPNSPRQYHETRR
jgi:S-DNA-T family DNA segregation ATPase FtsK/SpoIIIE